MKGQSRRSVMIVGLGLLAGCLQSDYPRGSEQLVDERVKPEEAASKDAVVEITDEPSFYPDILEVEVNTTVMWENVSTRRQTVTAYGNRLPNGGRYFASGGFSREWRATVIYPFVGGIDEGETFTNTFVVPGTYEYYSIPFENRGMTGKVIVR